MEHNTMGIRRLILLIVILFVILGIFGAMQKYLPASFHLPNPSSISTNSSSGGTVKVVSEESVTIDTVKKVGPSVVTISETLPQSAAQTQSPFDMGPFNDFFGGQPTPAPDNSGQNDQQPAGIGSGFILSQDGMIVTNKHVVADTQGKYTVITSAGKKYDVQKIYRDPLNDVAIVKIDPGQNPSSPLPPVTLGDSDKLQVGQFVIAIGTALGEFNNTVTTGVISGLGRGITAGSEFEGFTEKLDNVIQTDAAINPGNSGGPLLNSQSQVIGVNTAVSQSGQNIGFALPINTIKDSLKNFNETGQFNRPYLGVAYKTVNRETTVLNNLPQGAYLQEVISGSPADQAGLHQGDIITKIDGTTLDDKIELSTVVSKKKVGDSVAITYWRDGKTTDTKATLVAAPQQ